MLLIIFYMFAYILAFYGAVVIIGNILDCIADAVVQKKTGIKLVLEVKDQEDEIEGIVRALYKEEIFYNMRFNAEFEVIDLGSKDETMEILKKLQSEYESLIVTTKQDDGSIVS